MIGCMTCVYVDSMVFPKPVVELIGSFIQQGTVWGWEVMHLNMYFGYNLILPIFRSRSQHAALMRGLEESRKTPCRLPASHMILFRQRMALVLQQDMQILERMFIAILGENFSTGNTCCIVGLLLLLL